MCLRIVRKFLLPVLFAIALSPPSTFAQAPGDGEIAALKQHGFELFQAGKYADALPVAKRYAELIEGRYGSAHAEYATALYYIAEVLRASNRLTDAEPLYLQALAIAEKSLGDEDPKLAEVLYGLAELCFSQARYRDAELYMKRQLLIREKSLASDRPGLAASLINLGDIYREQALFSEAEPLMRRALTIYEAALGKDHPDVATALSNLALLLQDTNRLAESEPLLRRALAIGELSYGKDDSHLAVRLNNLAILLQATNRPAEAEPLLRRALAIDEASFGKDHPKFATALNNLAHLLKATNRPAEAEPLMRRALAIYEANLDKERPNVATALSNLGTLLEDTHRPAEAEPLMRRALAINELTFGKGHPKMAICLNNLATLLMAMGRLDEAEPLLRRALAIDETSLGKDHPDVAMRLNNLAALQELRGNWVDAFQLYKLAMPIMTRGQERGGTQRDALQKAQLAENTWNFRACTRALYHADHKSSKNSAEAFEFAQWALQNEAADALSSMSARFAKGGQQLAKLVREQQDLSSARYAAYRSLDAASGKADAKAAQVARAAIADLEVKLNENQTQLHQAFPDYAELANPKPLSLSEAQALLSEHQALVLFLELWQSGKIPEETIVFALTQNEARWISIPFGMLALRKRVAALRCGLDSTRWRYGEKSWETCKTLLGVEANETDLPPFDAAAAHALYRDLFGGIEDLVKSKRLLIVPSGALSQLPFEALVTEKPDDKLPRFEAYKKAAWFGQRQAVTILPSVGSLKALSAAKASAAPEPFAGFGNPLLIGLDGADKSAWSRQECGKPERLKQSRIASIVASIASLFRGGTVNVDKLREQPPLPETADELCAVGRALGVPEAGLNKAIHLGKEATVSKVKALSGSGDLARARVVHFATHGLLAGETAQFAMAKAEPALLLTPPAEASEEDNGLLTASEVAQLNLNADWVVMSACNTAAGSSEGAEALSGLARAFFYAGARSLLVSHWYVDSEAAVAITTGAVNAMKANPKIGRAEALRSAEVALIARGGRFAHPSYWAPFVLVGKGGQ